MGKTSWDVPNFLKEGLPVGMMGIGGHIIISHIIFFGLSWLSIDIWLENKPYLHNSKIIFGVWLFDKAWEISSQLLRAWNKLWNHETHDKVEIETWQVCFSYNILRNNVRQYVHLYMSCIVMPLATSLAGLQLLKNTRVNINLTMNKQNILYLKRR